MFLSSWKSCDWCKLLYLRRLQWSVRAETLLQCLFIDFRSLVNPNICLWHSVLTILPMGSNLILPIHEKRNFSRATRSWFTDKMNSSSTNLQPPDWCCDVCNVKLNWTALSPGGWRGRLEMPSSATSGGKRSGHPAVAALLPEPCLLSWLLYLFLCASWIAQALFLSASEQNDD